MQKVRNDVVLLFVNSEFAIDLMMLNQFNFLK